MKLPNFRRLFKGDFPVEVQDLIDKLSVTINHGFELLYEALNNKLTFRENFLATVKDVDVEVDATGTPKKTTSISLSFTNRVDGCLVIKADNLTNTNTYPSGSVMINYKQTENSIIINNITGLQADNVYRLRIVVLGIS